MSLRNENPVVFGDQAGGWVYSVRQHRVTASFLGLVAIVALVATLLPKGDASAATSGPPAVLTPSTAYFGSRIEPRGSETQNDAVLRVESEESDGSWRSITTTTSGTARSRTPPRLGP